ASWLQREQEEAADDLAAESTRRPGALASSILKVWEAQTGRARLTHACAAAAPAWTPPLTEWWRRHRGSDQPHVLIRVQRLIRPIAATVRPSQHREVGLPVTVLLLAVTFGVVVPAWTTHVLHNDGVLVRVVSAR